jgi:hypothetical protein
LISLALAVRFTPSTAYKSGIAFDPIRRRLAGCSQTLLPEAAKQLVQLIQAAIAAGKTGILYVVTFQFQAACFITVYPRTTVRNFDCGNFHLYPLPMTCLFSTQRLLVWFRTGLRNVAMSSIRNKI